MIRTFRKVIAIMLALVFALSLVPISSFAETTDGGTVEKQIKLINPVWIYDNSKQESKIQEYGDYMVFSPAGTENYKAFFQLDFSGYEHLLRDETTKINISLLPYRNVSNYRLYDFNMYILDDKNDVYAEHYEVYSDSSNGMTGVELKEYVTPITSESSLTPFISRTDTVGKRSSSTAFVSSDANNSVLLNALNTSTDDSLVTIQVVDGPGTNTTTSSSSTIYNSGVFQHTSSSTFLKITCTNPEATPAKYVSYIKTELSWDKFSSDEMTDVRSNLNVLPSKYKGVEIEWKSSDSAAVNPETGVVTRTRETQTVTLTANLSYTDYDKNVIDDDIVFNLTLPAITVEEDPIFADANDGTTVIPVSSAVDATPNLHKMESVTGKIGGKDINDAYLLYADSAEAARREISLNAATGDQDTMEMSVYIPSGSNGVSMFVYIKKPSGYEGINYLIEPDGIYEKYSNSKPKLCSLEPDKWYTLAFVTPEPYNSEQSNNDTKMKVYVNGKLVSEKEHVESTTGFDSRFAPRLNTLGVDDTLNPPAIYFDNIRVHSNTYAPRYDALDYISYKDGIGDSCNLFVKGSITVGELKEGITKNSDTAIRVYKSLSSTEALSDEEYVEQDYVVVAAAKNGSEMERSYNYYTVDIINYETSVNTFVNDLESKIYSDGDKLSVSADFNNYTDSETYNVTMYTAQYQNGALINLWSDTKAVASGAKETFTCDFAGIEEWENTSIKIMLVDDKLNPYSTASKMRFNNANTEATLYLLGDSIVQTYVNPTYPIQGWGAYIGEYLNDNITVENRATGGWTTDHYLYPDGIYTREDGVTAYGTSLTDTSGNLKAVDENNKYKIWSNVLTELKAGDYVMIALGVNDCDTGNVPEDRFLENITTIYNQASQKGATVVFATPVPHGGAWDDASSFTLVSGRRNYGTVISNFSASNNSVTIPLGSTLVNTYNDMADQYLLENPEATKAEANNYVRNYFHIYAKSSTTPPEGVDSFGDKTSDDATHHNTVASNTVAKIIAELLGASESPLGDYVVIPAN